jgi:hypothetical protein
MKHYQRIEIKTPAQTQTQSRVLKYEKECCNCQSFIENINPANRLGYCSTHQEPTMKYDECPAWTVKIGE